MKRLLFIYNPTAGRGLIRQHLFDIIDIFSEYGYDVIAHPTRGALDAFNAAESVDFEKNSADIIVANGGDGTLGEVIKGVMSSGAQIPLGYIPAGTMNDFAASHNIPLNMNEAARMVMTGTAKRFDIGRLDTAQTYEYFTYVAAFGAFTNVSYETSQQMKNIFGVFAYMMKGVSSLGSIKPFHLTVSHDGETETDDFLFGMAANATSVGGMKGVTGDNVSLVDGIFECVFVRAVPPSQIAALINTVINLDFDSPYIYSFKTAKLTIKSETPLPFTLDGERGGEHDILTIECIKEAISLIVSEHNE
ncbi:MAG: diacylglycerol kinase family lipid kinase [Ruminococcus sp.]|jgi:YegS/Rv2252/BmrU family lipid kinase|nr:diacylglycerol kinase family lipid kinase [Ruminococcus sp.]